jgi:transposase
MLTLPSTLCVYAAVEPVDLRKGFDALSILVRSRLARDPLSGSLFVFFNRRFDRAKVLVWTPSGWCLVYKRLEKGRFHLPRAIEAGAREVTIDAAELVALLDGIDLRDVPRPKRWERKSASTS